MTNDNSAGAQSRHAEDLDLMVEAVREAGALALSYFGTSVATHTKSDGTPVSEADLASNRVLQERLMGARPGYGWLSEESADDRGRLSKRSVWIVDPIDGTVGFIKRRPEWTVIAALVEDGQPVVAAVYNPVSDEMFTARRGGGAWLNGVRIAAADNQAIAGSRLFASEVLFADRMWHQPWPKVRFLRSHSLADRVAQIAAGRADGAISLNAKSEWDLAAPTLLIEEAGGKATAIDGTAFTFNQEMTRLNGLVAAGRALHDLLIARTRLVAA